MERGGQRLEFLDGVRGWAAFAVLIGHSTWGFFGSIVPAAKTTIPGFFNDGSFAVHVFFVLSGVVLTYPSIQNYDRYRLQRMTFGRYFRLAIPIFVTSSICYVMLGAGLFHNRELGEFIPDTWISDGYSGQAASIYSWICFSFYDAFSGYGANYNQFIWTMPVELCGSFLLFGTLAIAGDNRRLRTICFITALIFSQILRPIYAPFFCGAILAQLLHTAPSTGSILLRNIAGLVLFAAAWCESAFFRDRFIIVGATMLVAATMLSPLLQSALRFRFSQWLGAISFPLYLVHSYVLFGPTCWLTIRLHEINVPLPYLFWIVVAVTIVLALQLAWLLRPVETLAQNASRWIGAAVVDGVRLSSKETSRHPRSVPVTGAR